MGGKFVRKKKIGKAWINITMKSTHGAHFFGPGRGKKQKTFLDRGSSLAHGKGKKTEGWEGRTK